MIHIYYGGALTPGFNVLHIWIVSGYSLAGFYLNIIIKRKCQLLFSN